MKNLLLASLFMMVTVAHAQMTPHMGLSFPIATNQTRTFSLYAKDYPGMTSFQFSLAYDPAKMSFMGAFNSNIPYFNESNFSNHTAGIILCLWFDIDLAGQNITDSTVLIQLSFLDLLPGGSTLCFSDEPLDLEFSKMSDDGDIELTEINLYDECYSGLVLLSPSATENPVKRNTLIVSHALLSQNGEMTFSLEEERNLSFTIYDLKGNKIAQTRSQLFAKNQSAVSFGCSLANQIYILQVRDRSGLEQSVKVFAN